MSIALEPIGLPEETPGAKYDFFLFRDGNAVPVADFLDSLSQSDRDIFYERFRILAVRGRDTMNPSTFRILKGYGGIYEFKTGRGYRIACFFDNRKCILVEGWKKSSSEARNTDRRCYERAQTRMRTYCADRRG